MAYQLHSTEIAYAPTETSPSSAVCGTDLAHPPLIKAVVQRSLVRLFADDIASSAVLTLPIVQY